MPILFTDVLLFKWIRSLQHSQDQLSVLLNGVCSIRLQVAFVFPALPPLFSWRTQISQSSIIWWMDISPFFSFNVLIRCFPREGAQELQVIITHSLSSPVELSKDLVLTISLFPRFKHLLLPLHLIIIPLLDIQFFRSAEDISRLLSHSSHLIQLV